MKKRKNYIIIIVCYIIYIKYNKFVFHKSIGLILYSLYGRLSVGTISHPYISCSISWVNNARASPLYFKQPSAKTKTFAFNNNGMLQKGVIVRHLCLPTCQKDSKAVIRYVYGKYKENVLLSIMSQYTPFGNCCKYPELSQVDGADP